MVTKNNAAAETGHILPTHHARSSMPPVPAPKKPAPVPDDATTLPPIATVCNWLPDMADVAGAVQEQYSQLSKNSVCASIAVNDQKALEDAIAIAVKEVKSAKDGTETEEDEKDEKDDKDERERTPEETQLMSSDNEADADADAVQGTPSTPDPDESHESQLNDGGVPMSPRKRFKTGKSGKAGKIGKLSPKNLVPDLVQM